MRNEKTLEKNLTMTIKTTKLTKLKHRMALLKMNELPQDQYDLYKIFEEWCLDGQPASSK